MNHGFKHSFRDDYSEGAHPRILEALADTNHTQQGGYGDDAYSAEARERIRAAIGGSDALVRFVSSGTQANILCIASALRPHEAVIAASSGHVVVHETGAIEATGHKIITVPPANGKLTPDAIDAALAANAHFPHMARPRLVYVTQATEKGTIYSKAELENIVSLCRSRNLLLLLDGARLGAALAADGADLTLADIAEMADLFWIGGTKCGALLGEAIVIPNPALREDFEFHIKQRGALLAKGRLLGLQFLALFEDELYLDLARHANTMAARLSHGLQGRGIALDLPTETNQLFPVLSEASIAALREKFAFHVWAPQQQEQSVVRLVTSWATRREHVDAFLDAIDRQS